MIATATIAVALMLAPAGPQKKKNPSKSDVVRALIEATGGADVRVQVVTMHNQPSAGCKPHSVVRPHRINVSGQLPFLLEGVDPRGQVCQTLVRATITAKTQVQTLKHDVAVGQKVTAKDFTPIWVGVDQAHGKLRNPVSGKANTRLRKNIPVNQSAIDGLGTGPVNVELASGGLIIQTSGERRRCRGNVSATTACVRLQNGMRVTGRMRPDGVVYVELP